MMARHRNEGLRKICRCGRRKWTKCPHPWHLNFTHDGVVCRVSLERRVGRLVRATDASGHPIWRRDPASLGLPIDGKTAAEAEAVRLQAAIRAGEFNTDGPQLAAMTLRQLVTLYQERAKGTRPQDSVDVLYHTRVPRSAGGELAFGDWLIADITTDTIERFREVRSARTTAVRPGQFVARVAGGRTAANRHLALLRAVFNWAIRVGYLERTPFKRGTEAVVKLTQENKRTRRLQLGEQERLFAACAPHVRLIVDAALETGCRKGELLSLQWSQVRFTPRADLFLPAEKTKTKRDRRVPISPRLRAILEMLRTDANNEERPGDHYVFGNARGQRIASIDGAFTRACARAQIAGLHFHDLRREAGSRWLERGVPLNVIQVLLGHTNIAQTSTYLGVDAAGTYEAMQRAWSAPAPGVKVEKDAIENPIASDCISSQETPPRTATNDTDDGQETTINIDEERSDDDVSDSENRSVDSSILSLATNQSKKLRAGRKPR